MSNVNISIITWDLNFRETFHSLNSLYENLHKDFNLEFLVVGKTKQRLDYNFEVKHIGVSQKTYHPAKLLNIAANEVKSDYILFCDGDLLFPEQLTLFLKICIKNSSVGLISRLNCQKIANHNFKESVDYKTLISHCANFYLHVKLNNFAPMIFVSKKQFLSVRKFPELLCFSTMYSKFGECIYNKLNKKYNVYVCPYPCFHQWHPTPKVTVSNFEKYYIEIYLFFQKIVIKLNPISKGSNLLLNILTKIFFKNFIKKYKNP